MRVVVRPDAETDVNDASDWYDDRQVGLGRRFRNALIATKDVRRAIVEPFPYVVYFYVSGDQAVVLAVMHGRRHPRTWTKRR